MPRKLTVKAIAQMNIEIEGVAESENGWIVLQLASGARLKFRSW